MDKKNKSLIDDHEHGIILNESGTSVSFGWDTGEQDSSEETNLPDENKTQNKDEPPGRAADDLIQ